MHSPSYKVRQLGSKVTERVASSEPDKRTTRFLPNEMIAQFHCLWCMDEVPAGMSIREYGNLDIGCTHDGIQLWCTRHEVNVAHFTLEELEEMVLYPPTQCECCGEVNGEEMDTQ